MHSQNQWRGQRLNALASLVMLVIAVFIATAQLCIYNMLGWKDGESNGETLAHYFEFAFEGISAVITFWFTMDARFSCERQIDSLVGLANHDADDDEAAYSKD